LDLEGRRRWQVVDRNLLDRPCIRLPVPTLPNQSATWVHVIDFDESRIEVNRLAQVEDNTF